MYDFPIRAALRDKECDTTAGAQSFAIFNTGHGVQTGDDDRGIRQNHSLVIVECGASRRVGPELLKILRGRVQRRPDESHDGRDDPGGAAVTLYLMWDMSFRMDAKWAAVSLANLAPFRSSKQ
jgi:hypothetical protein